MHGIQMLLAVLFNNHASTLTDINLENYAILENKDKADRIEYDNTLKALENIQVLLNELSNKKFLINYQLV